MNSVQLKGTIYNEVKVQKTPNSEVTKFMLQVPNKVGKGYKLIPITKWESGELKKGQEVVITGELETGSYKKADGSKVFTWGVLADTIVISEELADEEVPF